MKFYNYINENEEEKYMQLAEKVLDYMKNNCKKYIKEYIRNDKLLWSGRKKKEAYYTIKNIRKNRKPTDTPEFVHNLLDKYFKKHFGIKLRSNSLFCNVDMHDVIKYGHPHLICPIGDYETYYHPQVFDLYRQFKTLVIKEYATIYDKNNMYINLSVDNLDELDKETAKKVMPDIENNIEELVKDYKKGVLKGTYMKGSSPEIMLNGDKYMIVGHDLLKSNNFYLLDEIQKL